MLYTTDFNNFESVENLEITHTDMDGLSAALLMEHILGADTTLIVSVPNSGDELLLDLLPKINVHKIKTVSVTDIGLEDNTHKLLRSLFSSANMYYFDHHASVNVEIVNDIYDVCVVDTTKCAAMVVYDYFVNLFDIDEFEDLVRLTNDRDLKISKDPDSDMLTWTLNVLGFEAMYNLVSTKTYDAVLTTARQIGGIIKSGLDTDYSRFRKTLVVNDNRAFGMANGYSITDMSDRLWADPDFTSVDILFVVLSNSVSMRVRSTSDIDSSDIAKANGGGGHPKASGFPFDGKALTQKIFTDLGLF